MLRSILMKFMVQATLMYGIVTYASELSQNLVNMNEKFWAVWDEEFSCFFIIYKIFPNFKGKLSFSVKYSKDGTLST